jgi:hypothetical protein
LRRELVCLNSKLQMHSEIFVANRTTYTQYSCMMDRLSLDTTTVLSLIGYKVFGGDLMIIMLLWNQKMLLCVNLLGVKRIHLNPLIC